MLNLQAADSEYSITFQMVTQILTKSRFDIVQVYKIPVLS